MRIDTTNETPGRHRHHLWVAIATTACAVAIAACGSSSKSSTVAAGATQALEFSNCMRSHGVPSFPDPDANGNIAVTPGSGLDPQSPSFEAAQKACGKYMPGGGSPPAMSESERLKAFAFAKCMRSHGVPGFPDPELGAPNSNTPVLALQGMYFQLAPGLTPQSPSFRQAATDCGVGLPAKGAHTNSSG